MQPLVATPRRSRYEHTEMISAAHQRDGWLAWRPTVAALFLLAQLFIALGIATSVADPLGATPICHAGATQDGKPGKAPPSDCALCPLCLALAAVGVLPVRLAVRSPTAARHLAVALPPQRAPPSAAGRGAYYPTGPPDLA